jgi:hypothetical protein
MYVPGNVLFSEHDILSVILAAEKMYNFAAKIETVDFSTPTTEAIIFIVYR